MFIKDFNRTIEQMKHLCADLLEQAAYKELKQHLDRFAADEQAIAQFNRFADLRYENERKQEYRELTQTELDVMEQEERAMYDNPVIRKYLYAQRELGNLFKMASQILSKTIELGRLPDPNELDKIKRGCGSHG